MAHPAQVRLFEQQREYSAFLLIAKQNGDFAAFLQQYAQQCNVLGQGSACTAAPTPSSQTPLADKSPLQP